MTFQYLVPLSRGFGLESPGSEKPQNPSNTPEPSKPFWEKSMQQFALKILSYFFLACAFTGLQSNGEAVACFPSFVLENDFPRVDLEWPVHSFTWSLLGWFDL